MEKFLKKGITRPKREGRNKSIETGTMSHLLKNAPLYYKSASYIQKREFTQLLRLNIKIYPQKRLHIELPVGIKNTF